MADEIYHVLFFCCLRLGVTFTVTITCIYMCTHHVFLYIATVFPSQNTCPHHVDPHIPVYIHWIFYFNWAPCHEDVLWEWKCSSTYSLTWALDGGVWSTLCPGRFTPRKRPPSYRWIGGWVGPRAFLDAVVKRKIPSHRRESYPRNPILQPVAQHYTDWAIRALISNNILGK